MQIHQNIGKEFILIFIRCKYVIKTEVGQRYEIEILNRCVLMDVIPNTSSKSESPNHADLEFRSLMNGPTELILPKYLKQSS
jgi:hypothetical protein